jgi:hypothetical protein
MAVNYTLTATPGALTLSGVAANLIVSYRLIATPGALTLSGGAASLIYTPVGSYLFKAATGWLVLTGGSANLVVVIDQSYSFIIRDLFFNRLVQVPFFTGFTARKSRALPVMTNNIPYLGVYFVNEEMSPDGDLNAGEIRFTHMLKIGFSVIIVNNDPVACESKLDQAYWTIMNTLWRDPYLTNLIDTRAYPGGIGSPNNTRIEGVSRGMRRHVYGTAGKDNEMPIGEMQYEATVKYRADYAPIITDDLLQISVRTGVKAGDTQAEMDRRLQTGAEYDFDPSPPAVQQKESQSWLKLRSPLRPRP